MDEHRNICHLLMEEYELLRERIEPVNFSAGLTLEQIEDLGVSLDDLKRLRELERELDKHCSDQFSKFSKIDFGPGLDNGLFTNSGL